MKITVLSPHRDDAAFSVGLAIGTWIAAGHAVEVVNCFTKSRYCPFGDLDFVHANDLQSYVRAVRLKEDVRWSRKYARAVTLVDLNLRDAPQRLRIGVGEVCSTAPVDGDEAVGKIRRALERLVTGALLIPLGIGDHVDHVTARMAAERGWPETLPVAFYEDLPYAARVGAAEGIEGRVAGLGLGVEACFVGEGGDVEGAVRRKRELAVCYDSQVDSEVVEQIAGFCERYGGRERVWGNQGWRDSGL